MVPDIKPDDIKAVTDVLQTGMLIQGKQVALFEQDVARYLNVKHAIAISNGTATLHLALIAAGIGQGHEVIVPALSYVATANVVELVGATPVFVDIDLQTFNIDVSKIESAITPKTKAIIPVHEFGLLANMELLMPIAIKHNLIVIEDAACALAASVGCQFAGTFGTLGSFSFHPRKAITSGEGGMLITNDDALEKKLRVLRNHGIQMEDGKMQFVAAGFNYRLTDFQAALVHSQFKRLPQILAYKQTLAQAYLCALQHCKNIMLPIIPNGYYHTWQSFHIIIEGIQRDEVIMRLQDVGIGTNYGAQCIPQQKYYQYKYKLNTATLFPNALKAYQQGLVLPLYEKLSVADIQHVATALLKIVG
ncbi:MAG: DegT/DnrJ/EryC1/StrS family aminotransferase [Bacteroidia bacterium]|nr:DegT/DnrJ/EryC1/StrS family aminotransferase [Bacteroidia bacterium]